MKTIAKELRRLLVSQEGPTAVEYAIMLALIVIVSLAAIRAVGVNTTNTFRKAANSLAS